MDGKKVDVVLRSFCFFFSFSSLVAQFNIGPISSEDDLWSSWRRGDLLVCKGHEVKQAIWRDSASNRDSELSGSARITRVVCSRQDLRGTFIRNPPCPRLTSCCLSRFLSCWWWWLSFHYFLVRSCWLPSCPRAFFIQKSTQAEREVTPVLNGAPVLGNPN